MRYSDCDHAEYEYEHANDLQLANASGTLRGSWRSRERDRDNRETRDDESVSQ